MRAKNQKHRVIGAIDGETGRNRILDVRAAGDR